MREKLLSGINYVGQQVRSTPYGLAAVGCVARLAADARSAARQSLHRPTST